jgi:hypothetical protein
VHSTVSLRIPTGGSLRHACVRCKIDGLRPAVPFIVGFARSGTTLLRLMLDSHPELSIPPETHFLPEVASIAACRGLASDDFCSAIVGHQRWPDFCIDPLSFRSQLGLIDPFDVPAGIRCFYALYAAKFGKHRFGDKTPAYREHLRLIEDLLPEAHFIHVIRDGRDAALSNRTVWWRREGSPSVGEYAREWAESIVSVRRQASGVQKYLEIRYEDLVTRTRKVLFQVCDFLELPFEDRMESFYLGAASRMSELKDLYQNDGALMAYRQERIQIHRLTSFPPDSSRVYSWRAQMTQQEIEEFKLHAGDLLTSLNYPDH